MRKRGRRILGGILLAGMLGSLVVSGIILSRREPVLLERATRIADIRGWWPEEEDWGPGKYEWVSDTVLLTGSGTWRLASPFLYDIRSRQKTPLVQLGRLLERDNDMGTAAWSISPNGKWLLWTMQLYSDVRAARLDGSGYQKVPLPPPANTLGAVEWEEDSRHWRANGIDYDSGIVTNLFRGDVETPGSRHALPLSESASSFDAYAPTIQQDGKYIEVERRSNGAAAEPKTTRAKLYPPADTQAVEVEQNRQGSRIAWVVLSERQSPLVNWLRRVFPRIAPPPVKAAEIWISRSDGSEMQEAGRLVLTGSVEEFGKPHDLHWLPSGKSVCLRYKEALWLLPLDR